MKKLNNRAQYRGLLFLIALFTEFSGISQIDTFTIRTTADGALEINDITRATEHIKRYWIDSIVLFDKGNGTDAIHVDRRIPIRSHLHKMGIKVPINLSDSTRNKATIIVYRPELLHIYFAGGNTDILSESMHVLLQLIKLMHNNPEIRIVLRGHINWPYPYQVAPYAIYLARDRAVKVQGILMGGGISKKRIEVENVSSREMLYPDAVLEREMKFNRRVEIKII